MRQLERALARILRKVAVKRWRPDETPVTVDADDLARYLGRPRFTPGVGRAHGGARVSRPAWRSPAPAATCCSSRRPRWTGEPGLTLTGQLGDVMKESAQIALSYLRSHGAELGIDPDALAGRRIHLHVPAGAVPKDGPSAGITMVDRAGVAGLRPAGAAASSA